MSADTVTVHLHEPAVSTPQQQRPGSRSVTDLDGPQRPRLPDDREGRFCTAHGPQRIRHRVERLTFRHGTREVCPRCASAVLRGGTAGLSLPGGLPSSLTPAERAAVDSLRVAEDAGTAYARALVARGLPEDALSAPETPAPVPVQVVTPSASECACEGLSRAADEAARRALALAGAAVVLAVLAMVLAAVAFST